MTYDASLRVATTEGTCTSGTQSVPHGTRLGRTDSQQISPETEKEHLRRSSSAWRTLGNYEGTTAWDPGRERHVVIHCQGHRQRFYWLPNRDHLFRCVFGELAPETAAEVSSLFGLLLGAFRRICLFTAESDMNAHTRPRSR